MQRLHRSIDEDLNRYYKLLQEVVQLVASNSSLSRKVLAEERHFKRFTNLFKNLSISRAIQRRIPDIEREIRDQERYDRNVSTTTEDIDHEIDNVRNLLDRLGDYNKG